MASPSLENQNLEDVVKAFADGFTSLVSMETRGEMIRYLRVYAVKRCIPNPVPDNITRDIDSLERKWTAN